MGFSIVEYSLQVAPALGISVVVLYYLWRLYQDQLNYQREQEKSNLEVLTQVSSVLNAFVSSAKSDNVILRKEIVDQATNVKQHIDLKIETLKRH